MGVRPGDPRMFFLLACTDYDVSHSEIVAEAEGPEVELADGGADTMTVTLSADRDAVEGNFASSVDLTVFAVQLTGSPTISVMASEQSANTLVSMTGFVELSVANVLELCIDPEGDGLPVTWVEDVCTTELPVHVAATGGGASVQVTAHLQLNFSANEAPGSADATVEDAG